MAEQVPTISVNGRTYRRPVEPTLVLCIGGSEPGYIERAIEAGIAPHFARLFATGTHLTALAAAPTLTLPNQTSILTGVAPVVHAICGDRTPDGSVPNSRAPTILGAMRAAGTSTAAVVPDGAVRHLLTAEASGTIIVDPADGGDADHGYAAVLDAALALVERQRPDLVYVATPCTAQHHAAPGSAEANALYASADTFLAACASAGYRLAITADHGMNDKIDAQHAPDVLYLQDLLESWLGAGAARVTLPIAPTRANAGLCSAAYIDLPAADPATVAERLAAVKGVELALTREAACARFDLAPDEVGDLLVFGKIHKTFGTREGAHEIGRMPQPFRGCGGLTEEAVPLILDRPVTPPAGRRARNFDVFDLALNAPSSLPS